MPKETADVKETSNENVVKPGIDISSLSEEDLTRLAKILKGLESSPKQPEKIAVKEEDFLDLGEKLEYPKEIIFTIKGRIDDNGMYDGGYIPGKSMGVFPFKHELVLTNKNVNFDNPEANDYITGFNEDDYLFRNDLTDEEKSDIIKQMRVAKKFLERNKNTSLNSKNSSFWRKRKFKLDNFSTVYNTKNPDNLILYYNILGGGYNEIATSFDKSKAEGKLVYMSVLEAEAKRSFSHNKFKIQAYSKLEQVLDNWSKEDALFFTYHLAKKGKGYTINTPKEIIVDELRGFIEGEDTKSDKKKRPAEFLNAFKEFSENPDKVKASGLIKSAMYYGYINTDSKKNLVNKVTGFVYGTTIDMAVDKILDLKYIDETAWLKKEVNKKWNA